MTFQTTRLLLVDAAHGNVLGFGMTTRFSCSRKNQCKFIYFKWCTSPTILFICHNTNTTPYRLYYIILHYMYGGRAGMIVVELQPWWDQDGHCVWQQQREGKSSHAPPMLSGLSIWQLISHCSSRMHSPENLPLRWLQAARFAPTDPISACMNTHI